MKPRRLRDGDVLENGDIVLVRGGALDPDILRADAARYDNSLALITVACSIHRAVQSS